mgnify:CR=1 FL=1
MQECTRCSGWWMADGIQEGGRTIGRLRVRQELDHHPKCCASCGALLRLFQLVLQFRKYCTVRQYRGDRGAAEGATFLRQSPCIDALGTSLHITEAVARFRGYGSLFGHCKIHYCLGGKFLLMTRKFKPFCNTTPRKFHTPKTT